MDNLDAIQKVLAARAIKDEERQDALGGVAGPAGALAGSGLGVLGGTVPHMIGQAKMNQLDRTQPITRTVNDVEGQVYRRDMPGNKIRPGARMAGGLVGALVGGALGAGTAELVKRESPSARLLAKIQTQGGRLTPSDEQQLQSLLTDTYSNISDYRS